MNKAGQGDRLSKLESHSLEMSKIHKMHYLREFTKLK